MQINAAYAPGIDPYADPGFEEFLHELGDNSDLMFSEEALDALGRVYLIMSNLNDLSAEDQQKQIETAAKELEKVFKEKIAEIQESMKAQEKKGFWGSIVGALSKIAGYAGIAVAVAAAAVTFGAAAPLSAMAIVGLGLSLLATIESQTNLLQKAGLSPKAAGYVTLGLAIAGAACSFGATLMSSGAEALTAADDIWSLVEKGSDAANVLYGTTLAGVGGATVMCAKYGKEAEDHLTNAHERQGMADQLRRFMMMMMDALEEIVEQDSADTERLADAVDIQGATLLLAAGGAA
jgi:hypothetical protein